MKPAKTKKPSKSVKTEKSRVATKNNNHIPVVRKNAQMFSEGVASENIKDPKIKTARGIYKGSRSSKVIKKEVPELGPVFKMMVKAIADEVEKRISKRQKITVDFRNVPPSVSTSP